MSGMIVIHFKPVGKATPKEVAMHNLLVADKLFDVAWMSCAAAGWIAANPGADYADLQRMLDKQQFDTFLFSRKPPCEGRLIHPVDPLHECAWMLYFSCRPYPLSFHEAMDNAGTIAENYIRLADTGTMHVGALEDLDDVENMKMTTPYEKTPMSHVSRNLCMMFTKKCE